MPLDDESIEAIAQRVAEILGDRFAAVATDDTSSAPEPPTETSDELAEWIISELPSWAATINGDLNQWCARAATASGTTNPVEVLKWAMAPHCPTPHWRETYCDAAMPAAARTARGKTRYGPFAQMLAEYRLSNDNPAPLSHVDQVVKAIDAHVRKIGVQTPTSDNPRARKNAIELLVEANNDPDYVLDVVTWCLTQRPFWRAHTSSVPAKKTFMKMRADWRQAGQEFNLEQLDRGIAATVEELAKGWSYYISHALNQSNRCYVSPLSLKRIHTLLAGNDGNDPMDPADIKATIKWLCAPGEGRTRFYADGTQFPRPDRMRKAFLDLSTTGVGIGRSNAVQRTNFSAGDGGLDTADDELRGAL